jgi:hypothetical protein
MERLEELKKVKVHTRSIRIDTYSADQDRIVVEGTLEDTRPLPFYNIVDQRREPGTVHQMVVRLLIGNMPSKILDAEAEMNTIPMEDCAPAIGSVKKLVGMEIAPGFTKAAKDRLGRLEGCSHLTSLILTLGSAIVQGMGAHRRRTPASQKDKESLLQFVKNTCCAWREDGQVYGRARAAIDGRIPPTP